MPLMMTAGSRRGVRLNLAGMRKVIWGWRNGIGGSGNIAAAFPHGPAKCAGCVCVCLGMGVGVGRADAHGCAPASRVPTPKSGAEPEPADVPVPVPSTGTVHVAQAGHLPVPAAVFLSSPRAVPPPHSGLSCPVLSSPVLSWPGLAWPPPPLAAGPPLALTAATGRLRSAAAFGEGANDTPGQI
jgi:hypothetical protein